MLDQSFFIKGVASNMDHAFAQGRLMWDERRRFPRSSIVLGVHYRWLDCDGAATTADISVNGCRIAVPHPGGVERGGVVILSLKIPGYADPILVNPAKVQWVSRDRFGVEFLCSRDRDQRRWDEFIKELEETKSWSKRMRHVS